MEEINIKELLVYLKERILIIIIGILVMLSLTLVYDSYIKKPKYSSETTIVLVKSNEGDYTQNDLMINKNLVDSYSVLVKSKKVLNEVIKDVKFKGTLIDLSKEIKVTSVNDTEYIKITVEDKSATKAYDITKSISKYFMNEVQTIYKMNNVSVVDAPEISKKPSNNTLVRDLFLAVIGGLVLSAGTLFIIYYFDDSIKYSEKLEEELKLPIVGKIYKSRIKKKDKVTELVVSKYPKSVVTESIKTLKSNLEFSSVDKKIKSILITSSIPGEGKSFISSNLAISFALAGKKVLLVDSDLRKGRIHKIFKISGASKGYSNFLIDNLNSTNKYIVETKINNLYIIPRGTLPPNPSELLNSEKNKILVSKLRESFDIIIFDGTPSINLPDSIIMSSLVDTTLVISSNKYTPKTELLNTINSLNKAHAKIAGVVVNNIETKKGAYSKYYYYYGEKK